MSVKRLHNWFTVQRIGLLLLIVATIIVISGQLIQSQYLNIKDLYISLWANLSTEMFSIAITILIIDRLYKRHDEEREKRQLILQMSSPDSSFSQEAIRNLRAKGWLTDGSLHGANLRWANLEKGELWSADLQMADFHLAIMKGSRLSKANLLGALNLTQDQLVEVRNLAQAIMPDGKHYDGRYNLDGDFYLAKSKGVDTNDPNDMAMFYNITVEEYQNGQEWFKLYLSSSKNKFENREMSTD